MSFKPGSAAWLLAGARLGALHLFQELGVGAAGDCSLSIFAVVAGLRWLIAGNSGQSGSGASQALETLQQRYARGEIGREEFEQKKRDLAAS